MPAILLRLPDDLHALARAAAAADERSLASWVRRAIQAALPRAPKRP